MILDHNITQCPPQSKAVVAPADQRVLVAKKNAKVVAMTL